MAERAFTRTEAGAFHRFTWTGLLQGDTGAPLAIPGADIRSVQVLGNFSGTAAIAMQGSNEDVPTAWGALHAPGGSAISLGSAAAGVAAIVENTVHVRPAVTSGDGSTSLTVTVMARRS